MIGPSMMERMYREREGTHSQYTQAERNERKMNAIVIIHPPIVAMSGCSGRTSVLTVDTILMSFVSSTKREECEDTQSWIER
jgi:hypothetical protein